MARAVERWQLRRQQPLPSCANPGQGWPKRQPPPTSPHLPFGWGRTGERRNRKRGGRSTAAPPWSPASLAISIGYGPVRQRPNFSS